jgi:hypothetical protein
MDTEDVVHRRDTNGTASGHPAERASGSPSGRSAATPNQLRLLDAPPTRDWRLDESTREVGRRGIELARRALESARRRDAAHEQAPGASTAA